METGEAIDPGFVVADERYDSSSPIHDSDWLREHLKQRTIVVGEGYRHFRLNFNTCGTLQVLAKGIERQAL